MSEFAAQDHATTIRRAIPGPPAWTKADNDRKRTLDNAALVALDALVDESERLREALTYYAEGRYPDGGENAREALASISRQVSWCNHGEADRGAALTEIDRIASEALRG